MQSIKWDELYANRLIIVIFKLKILMDQIFGSSISYTFRSSDSIKSQFFFIAEMKMKWRILNNHMRGHISIST